MTAMTTERPATYGRWAYTEGRRNFITNVYKERVRQTDADARNIWENIKYVSSQESFDSMIKALKARPRVDVPAPKPAYVSVYDRPDVELPKLATEDGIYRDPETGTLYRLTTPKKRNSWDHPEPAVSEYSNKAIYRRLTPEGRMVKKGKWTRYKAQQSRNALRYSIYERKGERAPSGVKIRADWYIAQEQLAEYAVGTCTWCWSPLIDAVSVWNSVGPVCADNHGVHREMPPEDFNYDPADYK